MKLFYHVMIRLSLGIILVLAGWAVCFYYVMVDEINDEIDDSLEDYSELVIIRMLAGEELPANVYRSVINFVDRSDAVVFVLVCTLDLSE